MRLRLYEVDDNLHMGMLQRESLGLAAQYCGRTAATDRKTTPCGDDPLFPTRERLHVSDFYGLISTNQIVLVIFSNVF